MKKGIRRVLVLLLALSMVFTTTGLPVFADTPASGDAAVQSTEAETVYTGMISNSAIAAKILTSLHAIK